MHQIYKRVVALVLLTSSVQLGAATRIWNGNNFTNDNGDLLGTLNWNGGIVPINGDTAQFSGIGSTARRLPILGYSGSLWDLGPTGSILFQGVGNDIYTFSLAGDSTIQVGTINNQSGNTSAGRTQTFNLNNASIEFLTVGTENNTTHPGASIVYNLNQNGYLSFFNGSTAVDNKNFFNFTANGTLNLNQTSSTTFAGVLSGTGVVNVDLASSTLNLTLSSPSPNYTGVVNVVQGNLTDGGHNTALPPADYNISALGTLSISNTELIGSIAGAGIVSITGSGFMDLLNNIDTTFSGQLTGNGLITKDSAGVFTLSGNNSSFSGDISVNFGTLRAGAVGAFPPASLVNLNSVLDLNNYNNTLDNLGGTAASTIYLGEGTLTLTAPNGTFSGTIYGSGGLTLTGGTFTIDGTTSYTGLTTINGGNLVMNAANTIGPLSGSGGTLTLNAPVAVNNYPDTSYAGTITGSGTFTKQGEGILTLSGSNTATGATVIQDGTIQAGGTNVLSSTSAYQIGPNGILDLNNFSNSIGSLAGDGGLVTLGSGTLSAGTANTNFFGSITGTGGLSLSGGNSLTVTGPNSYSGPTTLTGTGTRLIAGAMCAFSPDSDVILNTGTTLDLNNYDNEIGSLSGSGSVDLSGTLAVVHSVDTTFSGQMFGPGNFVKLGSGTFTMTGPNTYTGETVILDGTIESVNGSIPANSPIIDDSHLIFYQSSGTNITQNGPITGSGSVEVSGPGTLTLLGNNSYTGGTFIDPGSTLIVLGGCFNGQLFGSGNFVKSGASLLMWCANSPTFSGTTFVNQGTLALSGLLGGNMVVNSGGTIAPTPTFQLLGNFTQNVGSTYLVNIDGCHASFIHVGGHATLNGGNVLVNPNSCCKIENEYVILQADGGLTGEYSSNTVQFTSMVPFKGILSYTPNQVLLDIVPAFVECLARQCTTNQKQVAFQLDAIEDLRRIPLALIEAVNSVLVLPPWEICRVLDQMSGEQYASNFITAELISRQFIRQLYDPIRHLVTEKVCCCGPETWLEVTGGQIYNSRQHGFHGFTTSGFQVTGGIQNTFSSGLTGGVALSYAFDYTHFFRFGQANSSTYLGGVYGLYTGNNGYWLADLTYGYTAQKMERKIQFGPYNLKARGTPKFSEVTFYTEVGTDVQFGESLVQPFVGIEADYFHRFGFHEKDGGWLDLHLHTADFGSCFSRMGFHVTNRYCGLDLSADLAWQCRLNDRSWKNLQSFTRFGGDFSIAGTPIARNSFEGALTATKKMTEQMSVYAEVAGQVWSHLSTYSATLGVEAFW